MKKGKKLSFAWRRLINQVPLWAFTAIVTAINYLFYHIPFFQFVCANVNTDNFGGVMIVATLLILVFVANYFVFYLFLFLLRIVGKVLLAITFLIDAVAMYFINTYNVILDESMISNVFHTNYAEASSFFSLAWVMYVLLLGVLPCVYVFIAKVDYGSWKRFGITMGASVALILTLVGVNTGNFLWVDKNSKVLGALVMPWSYTVNTARYFIHQHEENKEEILLPDATLTDNDKTIVVLVIGESSRRANYSLYGYGKNTNPLLSQRTDIHAFKANSCATYTTASVKGILEYQPSNDLYEILPNYLYRTGVDVFWRTSNWGEPPVHIEHYQRETELKAGCSEEACNYDEVLLRGLKDEILASDKNKIFVVLHTSTSHGPQYSKKYPQQFEVFTPVCNSVELGECSQEELINAYDNSIVYTDYLLNKTISLLSELSDYRSAMLFVSDHGESLGENNLYMHGVPLSIAPKEQYEIPFIIWTSDNSPLKDESELSQYYVFHSVLHFLGVQSPVFDESKNIFE